MPSCSGVIRLVFGSALVISLSLGWATVRRRDFARHRAWMIRGYAIAQGAGTQALIGIPWLLVTGEPAAGLGKALLLTSGWIINIGLAELIIRKQVRLRRSAAVISNTHLNPAARRDSIAATMTYEPDQRGGG